MCVSFGEVEEKARSMPEKQKAGTVYLEVSTPSRASRAMPASKHPSRKARLSVAQVELVAQFADFSFD